MKRKSVFELCVDFLTDLLGAKITALSDADIWRWVETLSIHPAHAGETLLTQGSPSTVAYVLVIGSVTGQVADPKQTLSKTFTVKAVSILGEIGLLTGLPHSATIQAQDDSQLLELSRSAFITLLSLHSDIPHILADIAIKRQKDDEVYFHHLESHLEHLPEFTPELTPATSEHKPESGLRAFCRRLLDSAGRSSA